MTGAAKLQAAPAQICTPSPPCGRGKRGTVRRIARWLERRGFSPRWRRPPRGGEGVALTDTLAQSLAGVSTVLPPCRRGISSTISEFSAPSPLVTKKAAPKDGLYSSRVILIYSLRRRSGPPACRRAPRTAALRRYALPTRPGAPVGVLVIKMRGQPTPRSAAFSKVGCWKR